MLDTGCAAVLSLEACSLKLAAILGLAAHGSQLSHLDKL